MNTTDFKKLCEKRLNKVAQTLTEKASEYSRGDRLSNFKRLANLQRSTPEKVCLGLVGKHIVALYDFVNDIDKSVFQSEERWNEKIGDIMAYMLLLEALIKERRMLQENDKV